MRRKSGKIVAKDVWSACSLLDLLVDSLIIYIVAHKYLYTLIHFFELREFYQSVDRY